MAYYENFKINKNSDSVGRLNNISDPPAKLKIDYFLFLRRTKICPV